MGERVIFEGVLTSDESAARRLVRRNTFANIHMNKLPNLAKTWRTYRVAGSITSRVVVGGGDRSIMSSAAAISR